MKVRTGFVSNSSSSSFMIAIRNQKLSDKLEEIFTVDNPLIKNVGEVIAKCFWDCSHEVKNLNGYIQDRYGNPDPEDEFDDEEDVKEIKKLLDDGWSVYTGEFSSDGYDNPMEAWLCDNDMNYEDDDIIIRHNGGF